jgi:aminopeptidase
MSGPMTVAELRRYAGMIVGGCVGLQPGDVLLVWANLAQRELVAALAEEAYRSGADAVDVVYEDAQVEAARISKAVNLGRRASWEVERWRALADRKVAFVRVLGDFEQRLVADLPPERVAESVRRNPLASYLGRGGQESRLRGTVCCWPTAEWAGRVFPALPIEKAQRKLARDLLSFCRLGAGDPPGYDGWKMHLAALRRRAARLTKLDLKEVRIRDRGTDLRLGIAPHSWWRGGGEQDYWGWWNARNVPTEECFVSPDAAATEGTFRCSRPRSISGRLIEGLRGEFRHGRLVRLDADREADRDWLAHYLTSIHNADRLGEIALVDSSSRIGRTGRVYYNGLIDENAAAHIAFGSGFAKTRTVPVGRRRYGVNRSHTHLDVMIGTDDLVAVGTRQNGRRVPLIGDGVWRID